MLSRGRGQVVGVKVRGSKRSKSGAAIQPVVGAAKVVGCQLIRNCREASEI